MVHGLVSAHEKICPATIVQVLKEIRRDPSKPYLAITRDAHLPWFEYMRFECKLLNSPTCGITPIGSNHARRESLHLIDPNAPRFPESLGRLPSYLLRHPIMAIRTLTEQDARAAFDFRDIREAEVIFLEFEFSDFGVFSQGRAWNDGLAGLAESLRRPGSLANAGHQTVSFLGGNIQEGRARFRVEILNMAQAHNLNRDLILLESKPGVKNLRRIPYAQAYQGNVGSLDPTEFNGDWGYIYVRFDPENLPALGFSDWTAVVRGVAQATKVSTGRVVYINSADASYIAGFNLKSDVEKIAFQWHLSLRGRQGVLSLEASESLGTLARFAEIPDWKSPYDMRQLIVRIQIDSFDHYAQIGTGVTDWDSFHHELQLFSWNFPGALRILRTDPDKQSVQFVLDTQIEKGAQLLQRLIWMQGVPGVRLSFSEH